MKTKTQWSKVLLGIGMALVITAVFMAISPARAAEDASAGDFQLQHANVQFDAGDTALNLVQDHSQFPILQQEFATGPEVTAACLSCHTDAAQEIMHTTHWTWEYEHPETGQTLGKQTLINNFCVAIASNEPRCTSCHVGYGWADNTFDFDVEVNVDCLVCHDTTGTYSKFPTGAGHPNYEPREWPGGSGNIVEPPDLSYVAQNVGLSSRTTCGSCHFYGGGGDGVKHGDMDSSLENPSFELDVHMDAEGLNFNCTACHASWGHSIEGSRYSMDSVDEDTCESCHTADPHEYDVLNQHVQRIACQTCHIPTYARGGITTKMWWDWSQAGNMNQDGSIRIERDEYGHVVYDSRKGAFEIGEDMVPQYVWFNGEFEYVMLGDTFDPEAVLEINSPQGAIDDPMARIWPMKPFGGIQPYDSENNSLVIPHLFGPDENAYWRSYDWDAAITSGMEYAGAPYSGDYGFIETLMYWPITHMVAPAANSLICQDCHVEEGGRLDFVALGYSEEEARNLTIFPPTAMLGVIDSISASPEACADCHADQAESWMGGLHGSNDVGCISCHTLQGEETHPASPYSSSQGAHVCGACHLLEYHDWQQSTHANMENAMITCVGCHEPHSQAQRVLEGYETSCETCHSHETDLMHGSTHALEGVNCLDCHKHTEMNTGHTFTIQGDTCTRCHGEDAHTANAMTAHHIQGEDTEPTEGEDEALAAEEQPQGANIVIPTWVYLILGLVLGAVGFWVVMGKEPGTGTDSVDE